MRLEVDRRRATRLHSQRVLAVAALAAQAVAAFVPPVAFRGDSLASVHVRSLPRALHVARSRGASARGHAPRDEEQVATRSTAQHGMGEPVSATAGPAAAVFVDRDEALVAFERVFAGEWVGFDAEVRPDGSLVLVPDYNLPPDLLEWGVEVHGYEHLTSSAVAGDSLILKQTRLLPATGCAVDAVPTLQTTSEFLLDGPGVVLFEHGSAALSQGLLLPDRWTLVLALDQMAGPDDDSGMSAPSRVLVEGCGLGWHRGTTWTVRFEERAEAFDNGKGYWEIFRDPAQLKKMESLSWTGPVSVQDHQKIQGHQEGQGPVLGGRWLMQQTVVDVCGGPESWSKSGRREKFVLDLSSEPAHCTLLPRGVVLCIHQEKGESEGEAGAGVGRGRAVIELSCTRVGADGKLRRSSVHREYEGGVLRRVAATAGHKLSDVP